MILWQWGSWSISHLDTGIYTLRCNTRTWEPWQRLDGSWVFPSFAPAFVQVAWLEVVR